MPTSKVTLATSREWLAAAIAFHLSKKSVVIVTDTYDFYQETPPLPTLVEMSDMIHNIRTFEKVKSPYDKGGRQKNPGRSIHALMCYLQHENPPCLK